MIDDNDRDPHERTPDDRQYEKGQRQQFLDLISSEDRWFTTIELVQAITHRFGYCIHELRDRGHKIAKRRMDDSRQFEYRYYGFEPQAPVPPSWQQLYYKSPHWKKCQKARLAFDNDQCCNCKATKETAILHVHHWRYDLFEERLRDLQTYCEDCHVRIHDNEKIKISFPKFLPERILKKLSVDGNGA